jgi:hypothetical protein
MSAGPSGQEDEGVERRLTYAIASTAAKTRARKRPGFRRIAAPDNAAWKKTTLDRMEVRDIEHCQHSPRLRSIGGARPPRAAAMSQRPCMIRPQAIFVEVHTPIRAIGVWH